MPRSRGSRKEARLSVSLDERDYAILCAIARRQDVSVAWVVRQAVHNLVAQDREQAENPELPLFQRISTSRERSYEQLQP